MNFKVTIGLIALLLIVGAMVWIDRASAPRLHDGTAGVEDPRRGKPLFTADQLTTAQITRVTLNRDGRTIVLERDGETWAQTQPAWFPIAYWPMQQFLDLAAGLRYGDKFLPGKDGTPKLADLGLDNTRDSLTLATAKGEHTIRIGRRSVGSQGFVTLDNDPHVYVVADHLHTTATANDIESWRDRVLDVPTEGGAQRIKLAFGDRTVETVKRDGRWVFAEPEIGRVGRENVGRVLAGLAGISVGKFVADAPPDLAPYGLDDPIAAITVTRAAAEPAPDDAVNAEAGTATAARADATDASAGTDGDRTVSRTLLIGAPTDLSQESFFAAWRNDNAPPDTGLVIFTLAKGQQRRLMVTADELRDARLTGVAAADVRELTLQRPGQPAIHVVRKPEGWSFGEPGPGFDADGGTVSELVESIVSANATGFLRQAAPTDEPAAIITLTAIGHGESERLRVWESDNNVCFVLRDGEPTGYIVPKEDLSRVFAPALALRDKTLLDATADAIDQIALVQPDGRSFELRRSDSAWTLGSGEAIETAAVTGLISRLTPLRVDRWLESGQPVASLIKLAVKTGDGELKLTVDPNTRIGVAEGVDKPFELGVETVTSLRQELRSRTVLPLELDQIASVAVGERVGPVIEPTWVRIDHPGTGNYTSADMEVSQEAAGGIFDALAGLRVERYMPLPSTMPDMRIFKVTTRDGRTHELRLGGGNLGVLDQREAFSLDDETMQRLRASLRARTGMEEQPEALPPGTLDKMFGVGEE